MHGRAVCARTTGGFCCSFVRTLLCLDWCQLFQTTVVLLYLLCCRLSPAVYSSSRPFPHVFRPSESTGGFRTSCRVWNSEKLTSRLLRLRRKSTLSSSRYGDHTTRHTVRADRCLQLIVNVTVAAAAAARFTATFASQRISSPSRSLHDSE